jgi:hypothetical protein
VAYFLLQRAIIAEQGAASTLRGALGRDWKGKASPAIYACAIGLAFADRWVSLALYVVVALMWLVPDRRMERALAPREGAVLGEDRPDLAAALQPAPAVRAGLPFDRPTG